MVLYTFILTFNLSCVPLAKRFPFELTSKVQHDFYEFNITHITQALLFYRHHPIGSQWKLMIRFFCNGNTWLIWKLFVFLKKKFFHILWNFFHILHKSKIHIKKNTLNTLYSFLIKNFYNLVFKNSFSPF